MTDDPRGVFMAAMSARFSALVSWTREEMKLAYEPACRVVSEALAINPSLLIGKGRPDNFTNTIKAAAGNLAARDVVRQGVEAQLG